MSLERPAFLLLLILIPVAIYLTLTSRAPIGLRKKIVSLSLRLVSLSALTAGIAGLALAPSPYISTVFLLDSSDSIRLAQQAQQIEWVSLALDNAGIDSQAAVVQFAGEARVAALPDQSDFGLNTFLRHSDEISTDRTHYVNALLKGLALLGPSNGGRLILLSDGQPHDGDLDKALDKLRTARVPVYVRPVSDSDNADMALESASGPPTVHQGSSFEVQIVVLSRRESQARLRLWSEDSIVADDIVEIVLGANPFVVKVSATKVGIQSMRVELLENSDSELRNNVLETFTKVLPPPTILMIGEEDTTTLLARLMREQGLDVSVGTASSLPPDYKKLSRFETILLANVPARLLTESQQAALRQHVAVGGRGLIVIGGDAAFGAGAYSDSPIDEFLPVGSNPPEEDDKGIAIVLAIDRSTSMVNTTEGVTKLDMAKEAAVQALNIVNEGDRIGILTFDDNSQWLAAPKPIAKATDLRFIASRIRSMQVGGGTDIYTALQTARRRLQTLHAGVKHVILITDGQASYGDFDLFGRQVQRAGISVSTIGIGLDADLELLEKIAKDGRGRHYYVPDPSKIPAVLTKETRLTQNFQIVSRRHQPRLLAPSPIFQSSAAEATLPFLDGFVRTQAKPSAEVVLASDSNDPILATWQLGLGRVVAWTSDIGGSWSTDWFDWSEFPNVMSGMIFWASSGSGDSKSGLSITTAQQKGAISLVVDSTDDDGAFRNLLPTHALIYSPSGTQFDIDLEQTRPGSYAGTFIPSDPGLYRIAITQEDGQSTLGPEVTAVAVPYSPELRITNPGTNVLEYIANSTNGTTLTKPSDAIPRANLGQKAALRPTLLTAGMLLFLFDIAIRRVRTDRKELKAQYLDVLQWFRERSLWALLSSGASYLRGIVPFSR